MTTLTELRLDYHRKIGEQIVRMSRSGKTAYLNFADGNRKSSILIANGVAGLVGFSRAEVSTISGQTAGALFERITCEFLQAAFGAIQHLCPGRWEYKTANTHISNFSQYEHLGVLGNLITKNKSLASALGHGY